MEPCLFRHGKFIDASYCLGDAESLQWSHVFSDMVRGHATPPANSARSASMEPCLFRHGKLVEVDATTPHLIGASMEPCLFRHGKRLIPDGAVDLLNSFNGAMSFQTW